MPLDIGRFRDSNLVTHEEPEAVIAALMLWGAAWHQVPAASLPDDDRLLARYAGYGRAIESWLKVRDGALRGFVLCQDGRLYHRVLAEKANSAWDSRLKREWSLAADRHRKAQRGVPENERTDFPSFEDWKAGRPAPEPAEKRQADLPLEQPQNSDGTPPRVRARAHTVGTRTGAQIVPNADSDGTDPPFRRNDEQIPAESALKGREGKGRNKDSSQPTSLVTRETRLGNADLHAKFEAVCEAAGFRPVAPAAIDRGLRTVEDWLKAGYDIDEVILPTIRSVIADSKDGPTRTLGRFRGPIAHEHARLVARAKTGKPKEPPKAPLLEPPDEDPALRPFRADLLERLGPKLYALLANAARFEVVDHGDKRPLRVRGSEYAVEALAHGANSGIVRTVARAHGFTEVWS